MTSYRLTGLMSLLFNILLFFTGVSGDTSVDVYSSVGDTARLPCSHSGSFKCSSIMWGFQVQISKSTIELVTDGKVKTENEKEPGKLKVGSDCSLHINNLTTADTGQYFCRLYRNNIDYEDAPLISLSLLSSVSGDEYTVYSSVGDTGRLPCSHSGSFDCSLPMWSYHNQTSGTNIELVIEGKIKKENEKEPRKLKVGSDCSLHINNLTTADTGQYFCRLYREGSGHTDATRIFLSLLSISSSPSVTELKIGSTVTLHCQLHSHSHRPCRHSMRVTWVSETGNPLQGARYKVSETQCSSSLTLTLERSDRNMKWRCQLTEGEEQKASLSYTTSFPDENMIGVWIGSGVAICIAVVFLVILAVKYKRRKVERETAFTQDTRSDTVTNQNKGQSEDTVTYAVVNPSAAGKRKPGRKTAESETEYATINTSR